MAAAGRLTNAAPPPPTLPPTHPPARPPAHPHDPPPSNAIAAGVDTGTDPRAPRLKHVVQSEEIRAKTGLAFLHTTHCLGDGNIVVSAMGDAEGNAKGGFVVLNQDFKVTGERSLPSPLLLAFCMPADWRGQFQVRFAILEGGQFRFLTLNP
jgi:hypothetical protein